MYWAFARHMMVIRVLVGLVSRASTTPENGDPEHEVPRFQLCRNPIVGFGV